MGKQNLLKFLFVCLLGLIPLAGHAQTKLVAWEFTTDNNTVPESKEIAATTGTGVLNFYSSGNYSVAANDIAYGNVMFTAPANPTLEESDWTNSAKHDNYMELEFSMKGYQKPVISFELASDNGTKWRLVYSTDEGTTWNDGGEFVTDRAWHEAKAFSDIAISATNKDKVIFRILNVTNGDRASFDTRFKSFVVMAEEYVNANPSYDNEAVTATWEMTQGTKCPSEAISSINGAFSLSSFTIGDCLAYSKNCIKTYNDITLTAVAPIGKAAAYAEGNSLEYKIKPAKGLSFKPTKVSFNSGRYGTGGGYLNIVLKYADGTKKTLAEEVHPNRQASDADYTVCSYDITDLAETSEDVTLEINIYSLDAGKEVAFNNVVISGIINGTVESVTQYTLTTGMTPENGGTIKQNPVGTEFDEGTEITLTATPNFGYHFSKWVDEAGNELSTEATYVVALNSNMTVKAEFTAVKTYALTYHVEGGAKDYMVTLTPEPVVVDGKNMYEEGTKVTLTAASNKILTFTNWSNGDTTAGTNVTMDQNQELTATYSAADFIVGWDFYKTGGNGRPADFAAEDNDVVTFVLRDAEGNTRGWLDKSQMAAKGYEGRPAAVNWDNQQPLGTYYWQTMVNASAFTDIKVASAMLYNYNAYQRYDVEYSLNGQDWSKVGTFDIQGAKNWTDEEFALPADADNQAAVYIRWIADKTSSVDGTASSNDGIAISGIYVTGIKKPVDDGTAPVLVSSVPAEGSSTASANGKVVLTFDEKVKMAEGVTATLGGQTLDPVVSGMTVMFEYKGLAYATPYTFSLPANAISDLADNILTEEIVINFTTKARPVVTKAGFDFVVPDDGDFKAALAAAKRADTSVRFRIFIKKGNYMIPADANSPVTGSDGKDYPNPITTLNIPNVSIIGEDMENTSITNTVPDVSSGANPLEGLGKCEVLSLNKEAVNTYFQDITIKSGLKDATGRGAALEDGGNKTICKDVCLYGYQDTYLSNNGNGRFYFEGGQLRGRTDFLCGKGDVFYNGVELMMCEAGGYLAVPSQPKKYGYIFRDCTIKGEKDNINGNYTLGRPWGEGTPIALYINTIMEVQPSAVGWNEMSGGWPARFAEYNSQTLSGTAVDLSNRKTIFGDGHQNNPVLSKEEADIYTLAAVMGADDDWNPTDATEQASAPTNVKLEGALLSWDNNNYVLCWAICKDGNVVAFSTENTFTVNDTDAKYSVRAANEMGGLGDATEAISASAIEDDMNVTDNEVVSTSYYNLQGMRVSSSYKGVIIKVDTLKNGKQVSEKVIK